MSMWRLVPISEMTEPSSEQSRSHFSSSAGEWIGRFSSETKSGSKEANVVASSSAGTKVRVAMLSLQRSRAMITDVLLRARGRLAGKGRSRITFAKALEHDVRGGLIFRDAIRLSGSEEKLCRVGAVRIGHRMLARE